jgi:hypothetical protein
MKTSITDKAPGKRAGKAPLAGTKSSSEPGYSLEELTSRSETETTILTGILNAVLPGAPKASRR